MHVHYEIKLLLNNSRCELEFHSPLAKMLGESVLPNGLLKYARSVSDNSESDADKLRRAAFYDDPERSFTALTSGASPFDVDNDGWSALAIAQFLGHGELIGIYKAAGTTAGMEAAPMTPDAYNLTGQSRGSIAGSRDAPVRVPPPLAPEDWELRVALSANGTVNGTANQPGVILFGHDPNIDIDSKTKRATVVVQQAAKDGSRYRARGFDVTLPLHQRVGAGGADGWASKPVSGLHSLFDMTIMPRAGPSTIGNSAVVDSDLDHRGSICCDWMVFSGRSISDFKLSFSVYTGTGAYAPESTASNLIGTAELTDYLLTGASTAHVGPTSSGLENIQHDPQALSSGTAKRLAGQLALPLVAAAASSAEGASGGGVKTVGYVTIRYLFVKGYTPPFPIKIPSLAADNSTSSAVATAASSGSLGTVSDPAVATAAGSGAEATQAPDRGTMSPSVSYWKDGGKRTRLFGHRGSGADNSAIVMTSDAPDAAAVTSPPAPAPGLTRSISAASQAGSVASQEGGGSGGDAVTATTTTSVLPSSPSPTLPASGLAAAAAASVPEPRPSPTGSVSTQTSAASAGASGTGSGGRSRPVRRVHVPENTLLSLSTAAATGAEFVEFDVQVRRSAGDCSQNHLPSSHSHSSTAFVYCPPPQLTTTFLHCS